MMRDKQRYLLVEASANVHMDDKLFSHSIQRELIKCIGEMGYHEINPKFVKFMGQNRFIIKSSLEGSGHLVLALALMKRLESTDIAFYTLKSSGTIKSLESYEQ